MRKVLLPRTCGEVAFGAGLCGLEALAAVAASIKNMQVLKMRHCE